MTNSAHHCTPAALLGFHNLDTWIQVKPLFKPASNSRTPKKLRKLVSWPKREPGSKSRACYKWAGLILIHLSHKPQEAIMCQSLRKRPQWLHWGHTQLHSSRGKAPCSAPVHAGPCGWGCELSNSPPHAIHSSAFVSASCCAKIVWK